MRVYRITLQKRASDLQGTGGLYASGRWHSKGSRILYTSQSIALAKLEVLANATGKVPINQALISLEFTDDSSTLSLPAAELPEHWHRFPYPAELAGMTEAWIHEAQYWILKVPSAQSPQEFNYLFNPLHPAHHNLKIISINTHEFDRRFKA